MVGMEGPTFDVLGFLAEPRHPASVATVSGRGRPALAMMWFLLEDDRIWFHTAEPPGPPAPFLRAARQRAEVAQVGTAGDGSELPPVVDVTGTRHGRDVSRLGERPDRSVVRAGRVVLPGRLTS
jgi:Pyridoxamine 5'-phosphate oxidase